MSAKIITEDNKDIVIGILKFVYPQYSQDFEEGNLYFNDLVNFHKIEHDHIGDKLEGVISSKLGDKNNSTDEIEMTFRNLENKNAKIHKINVKEVVIKNTHDIVNEFKINCFTIVRLGDLEEVSENRLKFKESFINKISGINDNRNVYLTFDVYNFVESIKEEFGKIDSYFKADYVKYFKDEHPLFKKLSTGKQLTGKDYIDASFYKSDKYSDQNEYRILVHKLSGNKVNFRKFPQIFNELNSLDETTIYFKWIE